MAVDCGDNCGAFGHWWSKGCKAKSDCVCTTCAGLNAIDPNLYASCLAACNTNDDKKRPKSQEQFLCSQVGGEELFSRYHLTRCGYNPDESIEAKKNKEAQTLINTQAESQQKIMLAFLVLIGVVILFFVLRKK